MNYKFKFYYKIYNNKTMNCQNCNLNITRCGKKKVCCKNCNFTTCNTCFKSYVTNICNISCMRCNYKFSEKNLCDYMGICYAIEIYKSVLFNEQMKIVHYSGPGSSVNIGGRMVTMEFHIDTGCRELDLEYSYNMIIPELNVLCDDLRIEYFKFRKSNTWMRNQVSKIVFDYFSIKQINQQFNKKCSL